MASVATSAQARQVQNRPPSLGQKRLGLRFPDSVGGFLKGKSKKSPPTKGPIDAGEVETKKDLEVPLYRRYASLRSRTPSTTKDEPTAPNPVTNPAPELEMAATEEIEVVNRVESGLGTEGAEIAQAQDTTKPEAPATDTNTTTDDTTESPPTQAAAATAAPVTSTANKATAADTTTTTNTDDTTKPPATQAAAPVASTSTNKEKPLPEPSISAKVTSKLLNVLPKRERKVSEKGSSASAGDSHSERSAGRRLLGRVGNIVHRKSKVVPDHDGLMTKEKGEPTDEVPAVPAKSVAVEANQAPVDSEGEGKDVEASASPQAEEPRASEASPVLGTVASKATKIARRLSARGLGSFQSKSKTDASTSKGANDDSAASPPVSNASLVAQQLSTEAPNDTTVTQPAPISASEAQVEGEGAVDAKPTVTDDVQAQPESKPTEPEEATSASTSTATTTAKLQAVTSRATKLVRRLSARGLSALQPKSKHPVDSDSSQAVPVSKASLVAQQLSAEESAGGGAEERKEVLPAPGVEGKVPTEVSEDKVLPTPTPLPPQATSEDADATEKESQDKGKEPERPPPTSFKSATKIARRLSTRASGLLSKKSKPKESDSTAVPTDDADILVISAPPAAGSAPPENTTNETEAVAEGEGEGEGKQPTPEVPQAQVQPPLPLSPTERATEMARKLAQGAQGAISKVKHKTTRSKAKPATASSEVEVETKPTDVQHEVSTAAEGAIAQGEDTQEKRKEDESTGVPEASAEGSTAAPAAEEPSLVQAVKNSEETAEEEKAEEKALPPPPTTTSWFGGLFGGKAKPKAEEPVLSDEIDSSNDVGEVDATKQTVPSTKENLEVAAADGEDTITTAPKDPNATVAEVTAAEGSELKVESAENPEAVATEVEVEAAAANKPATAKSLPAPPPPSAAAKVGKLSRQLSSRVGAVFRGNVATTSTGTVTKPEEAAPIEEKKVEGEAVHGGVDGPEKEKAEVDVGVGGEVAPVEDSTAAPAPPTEDAAAPSTEKEATASAPPRAFSRATKPKIGRRLSARVGDIFKAKALKDAKAAEERKPTEGASTPQEPKEESSKVEEAAAAAKDDWVTVGGDADHLVKDTTQPEASTSATGTPSDKANKPLPSKPSRSVRAKDAAAGVGRQLSIKATGLLKPRPRLEEVVAAPAPVQAAAVVPQSATRNDKGKQKEEDPDAQPPPVVEHHEPKEETAALSPSLGSRISKRLVEGIFGPPSPEVPPKDSVNDKPTPEEVSEASVPAEMSKPAEDTLTSEDMNGASVEAVEGGGGEVVAEGEKKAAAAMTTGTVESTAEQRQLSARVAGFFRPRPKTEHGGVTSSSSSETAADKLETNTHQPVAVEETAAKEGKRRPLSLGFLSAKKKDSKKAASEASVPPEVPPKDVDTGKALSAEKEEIPTAALTAPESDEKAESLKPVGAEEGEEKKVVEETPVVPVVS